MLKYSYPTIKLRTFDGEEISTAISGNSKAIYSDKLLHKYSYGDSSLNSDGLGLNSSVSVKFQNLFE
jgi:hypothetical protein